jgi:hypothetical protein
MIEKLIQAFYLPQLKKLDKKIGCRLVFKYIPSRFIQSWVHCDMTHTWRKVGLNIIHGANYFTVGHIVNGDSSRFDRNAPEYQSWLGAYTLKLAPGTPWSPREHFRLAIADQNNWLRWYGEHHPHTNMDGWRLHPLGEVRVDKYKGELYEFGCNTESDVGRVNKSINLFAASHFMAAMFNTINPKAGVRPSELRPKVTRKNYESLKLKGYIAIFEVKPNVKIVFYGNGALINHKNNVENTFDVLKNDLLDSIKACKIFKTRE